MICDVCHAMTGRLVGRPQTNNPVYSSELQRPSPCLTLSVSSVQQRLHSQRRASSRAQSSRNDQEVEADRPAADGDVFKGFGTEESRKTTRRQSPSLQSRQQAPEAAPPSQLEQAAVSALSLGFLVVLAEGLFLAGSGFLPEGADTFASQVIYPTFSPTVGILLAGSVAFGLWKSRQGT